MRTDPWWVCSCGKPITKVGKGHEKAWRAHLKENCKAKQARDNRAPGTYVSFGMSIEQVPQRKP